MEYCPLSWGTRSPSEDSVFSCRVGPKSSGPAGGATPCVARLRRSPSRSSRSRVPSGTTRRCRTSADSPASTSTSSGLTPKPWPPSRRLAATPIKETSAADPDGRVTVVTRSGRHAPTLCQIPSVGGTACDFGSYGTKHWLSNSCLERILPRRPDAASSLEGTRTDGVDVLLQRPASPFEVSDSPTGACSLLAGADILRSGRAQSCLRWGR